MTATIHLRLIATAGLLLAMLAVWPPPAGAATVNKCVINGSVTFQEAPCPAALPRKDPSLEELNAAEKQRRAAAASAAAAAPKAPPPAATAAPGGFRCDGRQYCSQMRSCAEARYFLAHCPGVKMDGDGNGVPCERQWCAP